MHPLSGQNALGMQLPHTYAAVIAHRDGKNLVVQAGSFMLVKEGTHFAPLYDSGFQVISEDGVPIQATGSYYISVETMDPQHVIIDWSVPSKTTS